MNAEEAAESSRATTDQSARSGLICGPPLGTSSGASGSLVVCSMVSPSGSSSTVAPSSLNRRAVANTRVSSEPTARL